MQEKALENYPNIKKTFDKCEDEPIHLIGKVQSFGFVLVLNPYSLTIEQVSENVAEFLKLAPKELLKKRIFNVLKASNQKSFSNWLHSLQEENSPFTLLFNKKLFNITAVREKSYILLECEPFQVRDNLRQTNLIAYSSRLLQLLENSRNPEALFATTAKEIRKFLGYDRVLIMRFGEDWNGYVVAESKTPRMQSFINHHFPPSDIPEQARKMLVSTPLRYIADTESEPFSLIPYVNPISEAPIDLQPALLRNPSEFHLQYLRNMEVRSTITHSVIIKGKLWGIITAHNSEVNPVSFEKRQILTLIVKYFNQQLLLKEQNQKQILLNVYSQAVDIISDQMQERYDLVEGLTNGMYNLLDVVEAKGGGIFHEEKLYLVGSTPTEEEVLDILDWFSSSNYGLRFKTNQLSKFIPNAEKYKEIASGLLIAKLSEKVDSFLFWFKPEIVQEIAWAGNPHKKIGKNLSPRRTFDSWIEKAEGHSKNWLQAEIEAVDKLVNSCLEIEFISKKYLNKKKQINGGRTREYQLLQQELDKTQLELKKAQEFQARLANQLNVATKEKPFKQAQTQNEFVALLLDKEHKILFMNTPAKSYFKNRQGKSIKKGDDILDFISQADQESYIKNFEKALQGVNVSEEKRLEIDQEETWVEENFYAYYNKEGKIWAVAYDLTDITQRKANQHSLENLALIAKNTLSGVILCDKFGRIEWANDAFCKLTEYSREELISKRPEDMLRGPETESNKALKNDNQVNNYQDFREEILNYTKSGKKLWLDIEAHTYKDHYGREKYFTINTDITNEKLAEKRLKESEEKYSLLSENSHDLICLYDKNGKFLYISPSVKDILGYTQEELSDKDYSYFVRSIHQNKIKNTFKDALKGETFSKVEYTSKTKNQASVWLQTSFKPIFNEEGKVIKILSSSRDITEQKEQEFKIADLNQKLISAMEISKVAWWEWDINSGKFTYSDSLLNLTGWSKKDLGDQMESFFEIVHKSDKTRLLRRMASVNESNQSYFEEDFRILCSKHNFKWMTSKIFVVQNNSQNQAIALKGVVMDVHDWKKTQKRLKKKNKELKKINKELDNFVYSVSHDLRSPIASVMGLINVMSEINDNSSLNQYFEMQLRSLQKLDGFIYDILDFSKNNRLELVPKEIHLESMVTDLLEQFEHFYQKNDIKFSILIDESLHINTDEQRLNIILRNLLSNAIRYSAIKKDQPFIKISADKRKDSTLITVEDNGIGIERKYLHKIYNMFFRATNINNGSGLGLYIVKEAVKKIKGKIGVQSEFGQGTEFSVSIPDLELKGQTFVD